jgi:hypothetical protein
MICHTEIFGGAEQWRILVRQTAPMWLDYEGDIALA